MAAKPQTSDERKRAFNALFETVKADGEGTAMGSTDKARDEALGGLTFDKLPDHAPEYQVPEVPKPKAESTDLMEESHEGRDGAPTQPLQLDENIRSSTRSLTTSRMCKLQSMVAKRSPRTRMSSLRLCPTNLMNTLCQTYPKRRNGTFLRRIWRPGNELRRLNRSTLSDTTRRMTLL